MQSCTKLVGIQPQHKQLLLTTHTHTHTHILGISLMQPKVFQLDSTPSIISLSLIHQKHVQVEGNLQIYCHVQMT